MNLHILNMYLHPGAARLRSGRLDDPLRERLLADLDRLESLAASLRTANDPDALTGRGRAAWEEFRRLLSLDAPREVQRLEAGWYESFRAGLKEDRVLLTVRNHGPATGPPLGDLQQGRAWFRAFRYDLPAGGAFERLTARAASRRVQPIGPQGGPATAREIRRHVSMLIEEDSARYAPPGCGTLRVDLIEPRGGLDWPPDAVARATGWTWAIAGGPRHGLMVRVDAAAAAGSEGSPAAEIWFERTASAFPAPGRDGPAPPAAERADVRRHFTDPEGNGRVLLLRVAALLRWLATEPRRRPWEDVFRDLTTVDGRPLVPRLLGELAQHGRHIATRPAEERKALLRILPHVVRAAAWRDVRRYGHDVTEPLAGRDVDLGPVHHEVTLRCPEEPSDRDLEFLLDMAARLGVDLRRARPMVEAVRAFAPSHRLGPEVRACLRRLLIDRPPTLPPAAWGPINATLQRCLVRADDGQLAGVVAALRAPLRTVRDADPGREMVRTFLEAVVQPIVAARMPAPSPGVWQADGRHVPAFRILEAFRGLVSDLNIGPWDPETLAWAEVILPRGGADRKGPCPGSFWELARTWLDRRTEDLPACRSRYQAEVATGLTAQHLSPSSPGTRASGATLRDLGRWLRGGSVDAAVYRAIVATVIDALIGASPATDRAVGVLLEIGPRGDAEAAVLGPLLRRVLELHPWAGPLDGSFRGWLVELISGPRGDSARDPWQGLARLAVRGLMLGTPTEIPAWAAVLGDAPPAVPWVRIDWERSLDEFEGLAQGQLLGQPLLSLEHLARLASIPAGSSALYERWRSWLDQWDRWRAAAPAGNSGDFLGPGSRWALLASCFRADRGPLKEQTRRLWPAVPSALILGGQDVLLGGFLDACRDSGLAITDPARLGVASEVLAGVDESGPAGPILERLDALARLSEEPIARLWGRTAALAGPLGPPLFLRLADALFCSRGVSAQRLLADEAWRQAMAIRADDPLLARRLARLGTSTQSPAAGSRTDSGE